ncbi:NAD(P)/FAD-dependent oxidoreductase [Alphaproteobacteria bacterium]|nr:NAD(P)/FAD-dependent oxidoreductase [Alphaproteobacteria bacterium]
MRFSYDVVIIGAGAAGLMCAIEAGKRGRQVIVLDHARKIAEKIRISGGGRCNFTNRYANPDAFLSHNPHFMKSALQQYSQHDFVALVEKHGIAYHEKKLGQLFCDDSAQDIISMLLDECADAGVTISSETHIKAVEHLAKDGFAISTDRGAYHAQSLVIASGGLSIPKIGATGFGYDIARQFGLGIRQTSAGLVPLTFADDLLARCKDISGLSVEAKVQCGKTRFAEGLLFTHRGLSGPSILQISSYWDMGQTLSVNLAPTQDMRAVMTDRKRSHPKQDAQTTLSEFMPKRLAGLFCALHDSVGRLADMPDKKLAALGVAVNDWHVLPSGTEGYRTAEVTLGGVDTDDLSSKTMAARAIAGLYFIGEVVDVTGHLGGYNFQWAWSSGFAAGQNA